LYYSYNTVYHFTYVSDLEKLIKELKIVNEEI